MLHTAIQADTIKDQDMDGVPDIIDKCPNTPFLNEVDKSGCANHILTLPEENDNRSLTLSLGYGFSNNEDFIDRRTQYSSKFKLVYSLKEWSYSLRTEYLYLGNYQGLEDTTIKIKRKFRFSKSLKIGLGIGIKLPTFNFIGNHTDIILYHSLNYYPNTTLSYFMGYNYTFVNDDKIYTPLQNTNTLYLGSGYFFSKKFYANIAYSYSQSKFVSNTPAKSLTSTLFYRINKRWFTTLSYSHQIDDEDLHNSMNIKFGYSIF